MRLKLYICFNTFSVTLFFIYFLPAPAHFVYRWKYIDYKLLLLRVSVCCLYISRKCLVFSQNRSFSRSSLKNEMRDCSTMTAKVRSIIQQDIFCRCFLVLVLLFGVWDSPVVSSLVNAWAASTAKLIGNSTPVPVVKSVSSSSLIFLSADVWVKQQ